MDIAATLFLVLKTSIVLTVLSLGLRASWQDALYLFREPSLLLRSMLSMNVIMPLVAATLVVSLDLPVPVPIALVALAVSPVPPMLPKKELKAGGHASYAVGLLVAIALLSIITVPVVVSWFISAFDRTGGIAPLTVAAIVSKSVLAPLAAGLLLRHVAPTLAEKITRPIALLGTVLLVATALPLAYASWPAMHALFGNGTVLIIAAMAVAGLGIGHLLGGPDGDHRTVLALSTTSRHPGIALAAAVAAGGESKSVLAAILLYVIVAVLVSIPYVAWRRRQSAAIELPATSSDGALR
jgi:bile acid:Na+ symporter, BASS family